MRLGKPDILVQMKHTDLAPVDTRRGNQILECFKLAGPGGQNNVRSPLFVDGLANKLGGESSGRNTKRCGISSNVNLHIVQDIGKEMNDSITGGSDTVMMCVIRLRAELSYFLPATTRCLRVGSASTIRR